MTTRADQKQARRSYYERISHSNLAPLWEVLHGLLPKEPCPPESAVIWHYDEVRPALMEAGQLISAAEAERRVLVLENPALRGQSRATHSLYAGLQLLMPGEIAPAHRHTPTALRFIIEGATAYTAVNGERTRIAPGDFVITPPWSWHSHGNEGGDPTVWLDGLDLPIIGLLNAGFYENYPEGRYPLTRPEGDALARYGSGILPVDYKRLSAATPLLNYPYERTREALAAMRQAEEWDECHGLKMRYVNPASGDFAMATIGAFIQLLPADFAGKRYRSTDSTVYAVVEGSGTTIMGGREFRWREHDIFVVPSWLWHAHHAAGSDAVLFSFSDRPVQEKLALWRESRG